MSVAAYKVEIAWANRLANPFRIGVSKIGGTDKLAGAFGSTLYDDVTAEVDQVTIRRGRTDDLSAMQAGECTITLHDSTRKYDPTNASSPLYGLLVPMRRVRVSATFGGVVYPLFDGFTEDIADDPSIGSQSARIQCIDLFSWLDRAKPIIAETGPTTTGVVVGLLLDSIGWTQGSMRDLDTGDSIPDFEADGSKTALQLIQDLLATERGAFYVSAGGVAVYEDRRAISRVPRTSAQSMLADVASLAVPSVSLRNIRNRATVTVNDGEPQVYEDAASALQYGPADAESVSTTYLPDDEQAMRLARFIVARTKDPQVSTRAVELTNCDDATLTAILTRDLRDRVTVSSTALGMSADGHIEQIEHQISGPGTDHQAVWQLSPHPATEPFRIGVSKIGGPDRLSY